MFTRKLISVEVSLSANHPFPKWIFSEHLSLGIFIIFAGSIISVHVLVCILQRTCFVL